LKTLVILTQYFPPEIGAPQSRLYEMALGLRQRGWQIMIIAAMPNYPTGKVTAAYKAKFHVAEHIDGIEIHRYAIYASNSRSILPRVVSMLSFTITSIAATTRIRRAKPDYIMTESPPLTLGLSGLWLAWRSGAKHILNISDLWPLSAYKLGAISNGFVYKRLKRLERYLYKNSFACTGQSQQIVDHVKKQGGQRTHLFRNGVDTRRFTEVYPKRNRQAGDTLHIVYTGLLGVAQGVLNICKHIDFSRLNTVFHIYGEGGEKIDIQNFISANPDRNIIYHGSVSRSEIPGILSQYDVTLIPLIKPLYGAIPSKMYEAMAAGLPIIFAGGGEGVQIVRTHGLGWVCKPADYAQMQLIITSVRDSEPHALTKLQENCRLAARDVFDREIQIEQLHRFLSDN
jgi:glycosyltransferase involved in cell wall biosynthesis